LHSPPSGSQLLGLPVNTDICSSTETDAIQLLDVAPQEGGILHSSAPVAEGSVPLLSEQFDECSPLVTDAEVGNQAGWEALGNRPFAAPEDDVVAHVGESTPAVTVRQRPEKCRPGAALYWPLLLQRPSGILGPVSKVHHSEGQDALHRYPQACGLSRHHLRHHRRGGSSGGLDSLGFSWEYQPCRLDEASSQGLFAVWGPNFAAQRLPLPGPDAQTR
jgi:hypothetical protein